MSARSVLNDPTAYPVVRRHAVLRFSHAATTTQSSREAITGLKELQWPSQAVQPLLSRFNIAATPPGEHHLVPNLRAGRAPIRRVYPCHGLSDWCHQAFTI